jgi:hypothetical protein
VGLEVREEVIIMFDFGFTAADLRRVAWTLIFAALGVIVSAGVGWVDSGTWDWDALWVGIVAAVFSAVKNFVLSDDSNLK